MACDKLSMISYKASSMLTTCVIEQNYDSLVDKKTFENKLLKPLKETVMII